jgi:hypothetical protein
VRAILDELAAQVTELDWKDVTLADFGGTAARRRPGGLPYSRRYS